MEKLSIYSEKTNKDFIKLVKSEMKNEFTSLSQVIKFISVNSTPAFKEILNRLYKSKSTDKSVLMQYAKKGFSLQTETGIILICQVDKSKSTETSKTSVYSEKTSYTLMQVLKAITQPAKVVKIANIGDCITVETAKNVVTESAKIAPAEKLKSNKKSANVAK